MSYSTRFNGQLDEFSRATEKWKREHFHAIRSPLPSENGLVMLFAAVVEYADQHRAEWGQPIGANKLSGKYWEAMVDALRGLLSFPHGSRINCRILDEQLQYLLEAEGFSL